VLFIYNSKVAPVFYEPLVTDSFYRCNLGTVQRYLSTCYTEEGSVLDHFIVTITTVLPGSKGCCSVSLSIRWSHKMLIILVSDTLLPLIVYTVGAKNG
jgi:hypothetical protein